jgi:serine/threonine-protein kinase
MQSVEAELKRVLESPGFERNERLSRFLRFVVERHLEGRDHELKESVIGTEIFGRKPDYNPKNDAIVRTEARRLRALLNEYYLGDGKDHALVIDLPKGGYTPTLRNAKPTEPNAKPTEPRASASGLTLVILCLMLTLAAAAWWRFHYQTAPVSIAVLPLINLNQNSADDYFADGLTGEIIRNLSIIEGLAVRSQTSSFVFKGKPRNVREAGKQLQADYILEGSVLRAGRQLRIDAQLIRVRDDVPLWSGRYDRASTDVLAIQDEISRGIVNSLRLKLGQGRRLYETNAETYDLYLRARALQIQRGLPGHNESIGPFQEVIAKDPSFAPAYAGLAAAHTLRSGQLQFDIDDEVMKMRVAAEKALELDPLLAEAHDALGMAQARSGQWELAEKSFRRAIRLDPNRSTSYAHFALYLLWPLGRIEDALQQLRVAEQADPLSPEVHYDLSFVLNAAGRYGDSSRYCEKLPADFWAKHACQVSTLQRQGHNGQVIQMLETDFNRGVDKGPWVRNLLGCAYAQVGRRVEAEKLATASSFNPFNQAQIFACLGDKDRTFEALDRAAAAGPIRMGWILNGRGFAFLHGDPRETALRRKVGLPELASTTSYTSSKTYSAGLLP